MKRKSKMLLAFLSVFLFILIVFFVMIFPPSKGKIRPYCDENGNILPNSIAEKGYIETEDGTIGIFLLGKDMNNPVLMVCGGGPGIPQYFLEHEWPSCLPDYFTVCYWDYRGTGLSYSKNINPSDITTEKYLDDIQKVTDYLCERFNEDKIYILGHSFGTYMALNTVARYPERYKAYFAMSQVCNQMESEYIAYDYMKAQYAKSGSDSMVKKFEKIPIRESDDYYNEYFRSGLRDKAMHELGVGTTRTMKSVISGIFFPSLKIKEYTLAERLNFWKGKIASNRFTVTDESNHFNAFTEVPSVDIPVYFFSGESDYTCVYSLQNEYYEALEAPKKAFYSFSESAHSPIYEEKEKASQIFSEILSESL